MLTRRIIILIVFIPIAPSVIAQDKTDFKFGNITAKDFDISQYKIVDQNTGGVILYEAGSTHFIGNKKGWFSYVFTQTKRIKILNKKAFDLATIQIGLYTKDNDA